MKKLKNFFVIGIVCLSITVPKPAKADLFGGDGVPRMARV